MWWVHLSVIHSGPSSTHKAVRDKCTEYSEEENTKTQSTLNNQKKQQKEMDGALEEIFCRPQINWSVIFVIISSAAFIWFFLKIVTHIKLITYIFHKRPVVVVILLLSHWHSQPAVSWHISSSPRLLRLHFLLLHWSPKCTLLTGRVSRSNKSLHLTTSVPPCYGCVVSASR